MKKTKNKGAFFASTFFVIVLIPAILFSGVIDTGPKHVYQEGIVDIAFTWGDKSEDIQDFYNPLSEAIGASIAVESRMREEDIEEILSSESPPDLIVLSSNEMVQHYLNLGWIKPIENGVVDLENIYDGVLEQCKDANGAYICLPWGADLTALYWNKNLFENAGLDPNKPPSTLEELSEIAEVLTVYNADKEKIQQIGFMPDFPQSNMDLYARMFGASWIANNGSINTNISQSLADAMKWESEITHSLNLDAVNDFNAEINKYRNSNHPVYAGRNLSCQQCHRSQPGNSKKLADHAFYTGQVAMMVDGQWQIWDSFLPIYAPDMDFGLAPLPAPADHQEKTNTSLIQGPVIVIPSGAKDEVLATELISWILSPEFIAEASLEFGFLPIHTESARDPRFQDIAYYDVFMDLLGHENAEYLISTEQSPYLNGSLRKIEKNLLYNELSGKDYLSEVQRGIGLLLE